MKNKTIIIGGSALFLICLFLIGGYFFKKSEINKYSEEVEKNRQKLLTEFAPLYGNKDAKVEIVEFLDPECETCRNFYPAVKKLIAEFDGKVKLFVRYAPFHKNSIQAIQILEAARMQNKYWQTLEFFFQKQPEWGSHQKPQPELLWTYLPKLGLDVERIRQDMNHPQVINQIETDMKDLKTFNIKATPTFFVNGKPLPTFGYGPLREAVKKAVEEAY
ncbi:MAG: DsbA family protein [Spirochaetia bacterium]|nr:DsbA family protein [Spirochaetia bacterium]